jgi:hypothetical protein
VEWWPGSEFAPQVQFLVAKMAKRTIVETQVPEKEAEVKMGAAFTGLLKKYPNSPLAAIARKWLVDHDAPSQGGEQ